MSMTEDPLSAPKNMASVDAWLFHSLRLCSERLRNLPEDADPGLRVHLQYELQVRRFVYANRHQCAGLTGAAKIWYDYMMRHANLQIARYAGDIDEATFHRAVQAARAERDRLSNLAGAAAWFDYELLKEISS